MSNHPDGPSRARINYRNSKKPSDRPHARQPGLQQRIVALLGQVCDPGEQRVRARAHVADHGQRRLADPRLGLAVEDRQQRGAELGGDGAMLGDTLERDPALLGERAGQRAAEAGPPRRGPGHSGYGERLGGEREADRPPVDHEHKQVRELLAQLRAQLGERLVAPCRAGPGARFALEHELAQVPRRPGLEQQGHASAQRLVVPTQAQAQEQRRVGSAEELGEALGLGQATREADVDQEATLADPVGGVGHLGQAQAGSELLAQGPGSTPQPPPLGLGEAALAVDPLADRVRIDPLADRQPLPERVTLAEEPVDEDRDLGQLRGVPHRPTAYYRWAGTADLDRATIAVVMDPLDPRRVLTAVADIHAELAAADDALGLESVFEVALRGALALAGAAFGFVARVEVHETAGPVLVPAAVLAVDPERHGGVVEWLRETLHASARGASIPRPLANLARASEPLILAYEPRLPALDNFLATPIAAPGRPWQPIAVVALANRTGGFELELVDQLAPLLGACATVLRAREQAVRRVASEAQLARSERRFQAFMDAAPVIAYVTDAERRLVWASRAFGEQFEVDPAAVVGRREEELLPAGMAARTRVIDEQVRDAGEWVELLEPVVDPSGAVHWWQGGKFPVVGLGGEPLVGSLALDVSDSVRMSEALREREAALSEAQELGRLGRWTWAPQSDSFRWDPQFERLCGRLEPDGGIAVLLDLVHPDDVEPTRRALDRLVREGSPRVSFEHRVLVDGEVRELLVVARARREGDEGLLILAFVQDLSERRRLERSRRELASKAQKYESLSILAGGVAEEFAELFAGIVGNVGIALDDLDHDSLAAACVQDVEAAAERGVALTEQLDALASRGRRTRQPVELSSLVASLADRIHSAATDSIGVRLALHPDLPPLDGDPVQLRQLIMSLVANASEALADGPGELIVATGCDELSTQTVGPLIDGAEIRRGRYVWLEVRDTGPGMDEATRRRIFEPYFSTRAPGRGLGLATVLGIVRGHRGAVAVESTPGSGTRVRVLLPPNR